MTIFLDSYYSVLRFYVQGGSAGFINITGMAVDVLVVMETIISQFAQVSGNVIMHIQYPETLGFD